MNQKSITSFFKQVPICKTTKRSLSEIENFDGSNFNIEAEDKKLKLNEDINSDKINSTNESQESKHLSDVTQKGEQMDLTKKVEMNKLSAQLKLLSKTLPVLNPKIGLSWFQALRPEFDKPYFKKVGLIHIKNHIPHLVSNYLLVIFFILGFFVNSWDTVISLRFDSF